jgi:DNA-binding NarL/FixJ family response regulator
VPLGCLIVDDDALLLQAFRSLLEGDDLTVVGDATTAVEALRRMEELQPDVVLLDIGVIADASADVKEQLADRGARDACRLIFISAYGDADYSEFVDDSPAVGFIAKPHLSADAVMQLLAQH